MTSRLVSLSIGLLLALSAPAHAATYVFGPESELSYELRHPMHTVVGSSKRLSGDITAEGEELSLPLKIRLPLLSLKSGNKNRDANAMDALRALRFPEAVLEISAVRWDKKAKEDGRVVASGTAEGTLRLRGVSRPVQIPIGGSLSDQEIRVDSSFSVRLSDFGIPAPSLLFQPVEDEVKVTVKGVAHSR